jgi:transposase InsO family protein
MHRKEYPVQLMCEVLRVSRSGFYDWVDRPASTRQQRQEVLAAQIRRVHADSRQLYGSPRICAELKGQGMSCCQNTVAKLMHRGGIRSRVRRRFVAQTTDSRHEHPVAENLLDRQFTQARPNQAWCCDITAIATDEGWLYLAGVMDLCSRRIVGWAMADHLKAELCLDALKMALEQRRPGVGLLHHSDRGVQYACEDYQALLDREGIRCSMSRTGNCYDNAAMESFWSTLKRELVYQQRYATREQAKRSISEYIEVFYNRRRRHSSLGYKSPVEFEASLN